MKNIYLVGFMATGKTSVAKVLAARLGLKAADMDAMIEASESMPIREIFRLKGEAYFRKLEKDLLDRLSKEEGLAVACGGGVFTDQDNIEKAKSSGTVICLKSGPDAILRRTRNNKNRPLLNVADPKAAIQELLRKREPFYAQAHYSIDCDSLTVEESAEAVLRALGKK